MNELPAPPREAAADLAPEGAPDPRAPRVLAVVFLTAFLDLIGFGIVIPLLPLYVKSMGGSAQTVGTILSCFSLTQLLATPVLGRLSDRVGRRKVILLSLLGNALSMVLFALATRLSLLPLLFVSRIAAGATAGNLAACQAAIADVTTGVARARGMGRLGAGIGLGMVLGPVLGSALSKFGLWAPPLGAAAMAMADLVAAFFLMPETCKGAGKQQATAPVAAAPPSLWDMLTEGRVPVVLGLYFLTFLAMTNLQVALALLCGDRLGWTAREVGYLFGLFGVIPLIIQGGLIPRLTAWFGQVRLINIGAVLLGLGMLGVSQAYRPATLIGGLLLIGMGLGVTQPLLSSLAAELAPPGRQGAILGIAQSAGGLARTVGPAWAGLLYTRLSPGAPFVSGAAAGLFSLLLGLTLPHSPPRKKRI